MFVVDAASAAGVVAVAANDGEDAERVVIVAEDVTLNYSLGILL